MKALEMVDHIGEATGGLDDLGAGVALVESWGLRRGDDADDEAVGDGHDEIKNDRGSRMKGELGEHSRRQPHSERMATRCQEG